MLQEYLYMALNLNLKQVVAGKLASKFKSFVGGIGKEKVGLLPNMSDYAKLGADPSGGMTNLAFPLDVTSGPENGNHGHYVIFFVNEQQNAKIGFSKEAKEYEELSDAFETGPIQENGNLDATLPTSGKYYNAFGDVKTGKAKELMDPKF